MCTLQTLAFQVRLKTTLPLPKYDKNLNLTFTLKVAHQPFSLRTNHSDRVIPSPPAIVLPHFVDLLVLTLATGTIHLFAHPLSRNISRSLRGFTYFTSPFLIPEVS